MGGAKTRAGAKPGARAALGYSLGTTTLHHHPPIPTSGREEVMQFSLFIPFFLP